MDELFSRNMSRVRDAHVLPVSVNSSVNAGLQKVALWPSFFTSLPKSSIIIVLMDGSRQAQG